MATTVTSKGQVTIPKPVRDRLGIAVSDKDIIDKLASLPQLRDKNGRFDKDAFRQLVAQSNMSERGFFDTARKDMARQQLFDALQSGGAFPQVYDALGRFVFVGLSADF